MNEAGSKDMRTLDFRGAKQVVLKEIHSQTRERWTACTTCTSDRAQAAEGPPVMCYFKGGDGILRSCEDYIRTTPVFQAAGLKMKIGVSDSGSMRLEHVLDFLEFALQRGPGDDGRWRILLCDAYRAHMGDAIARLAWKHKYIVVFVGGGATGVVQVNDTHLHGPLQAAYVELEQADMFFQLSENPDGCPSRSRQDCLRDLALIWQRPSLHLRSSEGFLQNHLTNALDRSQDKSASSEVAGFWRELEMDKWRERTIDEVCTEWEAERMDWTFDLVLGLIEPFPGTGHMDFYEEYQDDEGDAPGVDGAAWNDREGPSPAQSDDEDGAASAPAGPAEQGGLNDAQAAEVLAAQDRLASLDRALEAAGNEPHVARAIAAVRDQVIKEAAGRSQSDSLVARAVRRSEQLGRDMDRQRLEQVAERRRSSEAQQAACEVVLARMESRVLEMIRAEESRKAASGRSSGADELAKSRERRLAIQEAARSFRLNELGQGKVDGGGQRLMQNRFDLIQRVFALGDERPPLMQANWKTWLHRFDDKGRKAWGLRWAARLRDMMAELIAEMEHGAADACLRWHRRWTREWSLGLGGFVVPGRLPES